MVEDLEVNLGPLECFYDGTFEAVAYLKTKGAQMSPFLMIYFLN